MNCTAPPPTASASASAHAHHGAQTYQEERKMWCKPKSTGRTSADGEGVASCLHVKQSITRKKLKEEKLVRS